MNKKSAFTVGLQLPQNMDMLMKPNPYTPDGNNLNERFSPNGIYIYKYHMKIYNRYGQKLFDSDACQNSWDGIFDGKPAPDGVYAYDIDAWDMKGKKYRFGGTFHLLR